jgi:hypothetical protein
LAVTASSTTAGAATQREMTQPIIATGERRLRVTASHEREAPSPTVTKKNASPTLAVAEPVSLVAKRGSPHPCIGEPLEITLDHVHAWKTNQSTVLIALRL